MLGYGGPGVHAIALARGGREFYSQHCCFSGSTPYISIMLRDSQILEDLSRMVSGAAGLALDARRELEVKLHELVEQCLSRYAFVSREEFEIVKAMAQKAREENEALRAELDSLRGGK